MHEMQTIVTDVCSVCLSVCVSCGSSRLHCAGVVRCSFCQITLVFIEYHLHTHQSLTTQDDFSKLLNDILLKRIARLLLERLHVHIVTIYCLSFLVRTATVNLKNSSPSAVRILLEFCG